MAMFNAYPDIPVERNRINCMISVYTNLACKMMTIARFVDLTPGLSTVHMSSLLHPPGLAEIVLSARSMQIRWPLLTVFPVYKDHVIAFSPPTAFDVVNAHIHSYIVAPSLGFKNQIIVPVA